MNTNKNVLKNGNSCPKHSKSRVNTVSTHTPSIKCHEEVMSKLSSCTNEDCIDDSNNCVKQLSHHQKGNCKKNKVRTISSKSKLGLGLHHSVSAPSTRPGQRLKDNIHPKTLKSKSIPIVEPPNLEDSVDFIPVKLTSANDRKQRPQRKVWHNIESRLGIKERPSKSLRPTWDEILRNNLEVDKPHKSPHKKTISLQSDNYTNCCHSDHSSGRTPNKDAPIKSDDGQVLDITRHGSLKHTSEFPKSTEPLKSGKSPIFQQINSHDPIKTLDFLIRQLRDGLVMQPQNDSLQNIIVDMENALLKISDDNKSNSYHPFDADLGVKEGPVTNIPLSANSTSSHENIRNKHWDIMQLEQNLERSCRYLQSLCIKQKENCSNHLREKDQLSLQLAESRRLLAVSKSREKNYEVTIGELRLKLQEANTKIDKLQQSLKDVEGKNATLKEQNQAVDSLKQSLKRAGVRLKQIASEKEKLQSKLSLKDLEIEKLKVLLQMKTNQKNDLQDNLLQLGENELNDKNADEHDLSMISLSTVTSWSDGPGLICSSQASSTPRRSPSPYNSWQHISSIIQQPSAAVDINRGIAVILQDLKKKSEQLEPLRLELQNPSSCSSLWSDRDAKVVYSDGESEGFSS